MLFFSKNKVQKSPVRSEAALSESSVAPCHNPTNPPRKPRKDPGTALSIFKFNSCKNIYLFEVSSILKKIQQKNIKNTKVKWIQNFKKIKKAPTIFFGNEFFDSIPIKQFKRKNNTILEKYFVLKSNGQIIENFQKHTVPVISR